MSVELGVQRAFFRSEANNRFESKLTIAAGNPNGCYPCLLTPCAGCETFALVLVVISADGVVILEHGEIIEMDLTPRSITKLAYLHRFGLWCSEV